MSLIKKALYAIFNFISNITLVRDKIVVYSGANFGFSSHSKSLYEFLVSIYGSDKVVFISKKPTNFGHNIYSAKGLFYLLFAQNYAITVNLPGFINIKAKRVVQVWHGIPIKGLGRHDKTLHPSLLEKLIEDFNSYHCIISPNEIYSEIMIDSFMIRNKSKIKIAPLPNMMHLLDFAQNRKTHSPKKDSNKLHILYAPTFRNHNNRDWDLANDSTFLAHLESQSISLTVSYHPLDLNYKPSSADITELLIDCDILITDYSSIVFDAVLLDKKVILFTPDYDDYNKERGVQGINIFNYISPVESIPELIESLNSTNTINNKTVKDALYPTLDRTYLSNTIKACFND